MAFKNPFVIDPGGIPPYLAGREGEMSQFLRALEAGPLLALTGARGTGKTVLLRKYEEFGTDKGWLVVRIELNERHSRESEFLKLLWYHLDARRHGLDARDRRSIGFRSYPIPHRETLPEASEPAREQLCELIRKTISRCLELGLKGLLLLLDEFQFVRDDKRNGHFGLSMLLEMTTSVRQEGLPFFLTVAGLPTLRANLTEAKTYAERMFAYRSIGHLHPEAAREAMIIPLKDKRVQLSRALVDRLVRDSRGYAYLVQFFPFYLIQNVSLEPSSEVCIIDLEEYEALESPLFDQLDEQFYRIRFERVSDEERELLFNLVDLGPEFNMQGALHSSRWDRNRSNQMILDLIRKEIVMRVRRGRYGYALPLFEEFLGREKRRERNK